MSDAEIALAGITEAAVFRAFSLRRALLEFYEPVDAERWLFEPQKLLEGRRPVELIGNTPGYLRVRQVLERLRDGAFG